MSEWSIEHALESEAGQQHEAMPTRINAHVDQRLNLPKQITRCASVNRECFSRS